jgi:hypothetical protein
MVKVAEGVQVGLRPGHSIAMCSNIGLGTDKHRFCHAN